MKLLTIMKFLAVMAGALTTIILPSVVSEKYLASLLYVILFINYHTALTTIGVPQYFFKLNAETNRQKSGSKKIYLIPASFFFVSMLLASYFNISRELSEVIILAVIFFVNAVTLNLAMQDYVNNKPFSFIACREIFFPISISFYFIGIYFEIYRYDQNEFLIYILIICIFRYKLIKGYSAPIDPVRESLNIDDIKIWMGVAVAGASFQLTRVAEVVLAKDYLLADSLPDFLYAVRIASLAIMPVGLVIAFYQPKISESLKEKKLKETYLHIVRLSLLFNIASLVGYFLVSRFVLVALIENEFLQNVIMYSDLIVSAYIIGNCFGPAGYLLNISGSHFYVIKLNIFLLSFVIILGVSRAFTDWYIFLLVTNIAFVLKQYLLYRRGRLLWIEK